MQRIRRCGGAMLGSIALVGIGLLIANVVPAVGALSMKACELLTLKDVQGVVGSGYTQETTIENAIMSVCVYKKGNGNAVIVTLSRKSVDLKVEQAAIKQQKWNSVTVTPVGGLGEGAYSLDDKQIFALNFGKGGLKGTLSVQTDGKPNTGATLKLAKIAYSRLR